MRLRAAAPSDAVALLPSDHYVSDDDALMARVEGAMEAVWTRPEMVVLLGIEPDRPEVDYGWIEPDELMLGRWEWPLHGVRRFWEKPPIEDARRLLRRGSLWNTFMIVANPSVLEQRIRVALPALAADFELLRAWMATAWEEGAARIVYGRLTTADFSRSVLQARAEGLAVLPVGGIDWNDLGDAARVHATRSGLVGALATS
jgi:mannose-1-phosphate guanylyltransferase